MEAPKGFTPHDKDIEFEGTVFARFVQSTVHELPAAARPRKIVVLFRLTLCARILPRFNDHAAESPDPKERAGLHAGALWIA